MAADAWKPETNLCNVESTEDARFLESEDPARIEAMMFTEPNTPSVEAIKLYHQVPKWKTEKRQQAINSIRRFLAFFIPSFLQADTATTKQRLHETAYLDGLRGFACYAVFFSHHLHPYCNEIWHSYGEYGGNLHFVQTYYVFQLPVIRLLYGGQAAVTVFFVLSGYVLSYKPLKLLHAREYEKLQSCLASSIFRRWWRLFLPVMALWIINVFLVELGAFDWFDGYRKLNPKMPPGHPEFHLKHGTSCWATIGEAYTMFVDYARHTLFIWPSNTGMVPDLDGHTWTLHVEFRCSCLLFLCLHGTSAMQPSLRLGFFILSTFVCLISDEWALACFFGGSAIADIDLRMRRRQKDQTRSAESDQFQFLPYAHDSKTAFFKSFIMSHCNQILWSSVYILGLFLLSYPVSTAHITPYYDWLDTLHPNDVYGGFFWMSIASMIVVVSAGRFRLLQRVLTCRFSQYIGKTSFALYLMHGTVIKTIGHFVVIQTWAHITGFQGWGYALGIILPLIFVVGPVTVIVSDWFWRGVDIPSVTFGRWLEQSVKDKNL